MTVKKHSTRRTDWKALLAEDRDFMKTLMREALQEVLEAEMTEPLGAGPHEREAGRQGYRAGHYERGLVTRVGKLEPWVPRDRNGLSRRHCLNATNVQRRHSWQPWPRCTCRGSPPAG